MKKYLYLFSVLCAMLFSFSSCETEGDEVGKEFYSYSLSFFYPQDIDKNYEFVFNGKKGTTGLVAKDTPEGVLEVYEKGNSTPAFTKLISLADQQNIQFIKIGESVEIYIPDKFISFTPTIIYSGNEAEYSVWFNNQKLQNKAVNYLSIDKLNGLFEIKKVDEAEAVFSAEMTLTNDAIINLMQISDTEFLDLPEDTEAEPTEGNKSKVRFYYPAGVFDAEEIRIDLYAYDENEWDWETELPVAGSVTVGKGKISDYVEIEFSADGSQYISYFCDMTDTSTDTKLNDYMSDYIYVGQNNYIPSDDGSNAIYKKVTYQILEDGLEFNILESLTTKW